MNRAISIFLTAVLTFSVITGCNSHANVTQEGKLNVVTSFYPLFDFTRQIGGEHVNVINMIPTGVEPHDWTPKSQDLTNVSKSQVFIYQGAGFESWTDELLAGINNDQLVVVEASHGIELLPASEDNHDDHAAEEDHHEEHGAEHATDQEKHAAEEEHEHSDFDPHTWLSPRSALIMAENVKNGLVQADPDHADDYEKNYETLTKELKTLEAKFNEQLSKVSKKEIVVAHDAFGYLVRDYGLIQLPMMGLAHDAEPTSQDLKKISEFVKEHEVKYIFTEKLLSDDLAKTIANDLGIQTLVLHPIEGITDEEARSGETYVSLMERNLENLVTALK